MISIDHIPNKPWVYFFKDAKEDVLYIGKAKDLKKRVWQYFSPWSVWKQDMVNRAQRVDFVIVSNESEALYLEDNLIKQHKPPYNSLLKGDNSYVFIKITKEDFPKVLITRDRRRDGASYIGPKRSTQTLKKILQHTRTIFQYRACNTTDFRKGKLCSDYHFGLCKGRCVFAKLNTKQESNTQKNLWGNPYAQEAAKYGLQIEKTREEYSQDNQAMMSYIATLFDGNPQPIVEQVRKQIDVCITSQNFERAARLKEVYEWLDQLRDKQHVVLDQTITGWLCKIQKMSDWYVYVLVHLHEWRLVDVIRNKLSREDHNINAILAMLEAEYGMNSIKLGHKHNYVNAKSRFNKMQVREPSQEAYMKFLEQQSEYWLLALSPTIKYFASINKQTNDLLDKFIEAYVLGSSRENESVMNDLLKQVQQRYYCKSYPYRVECVDISHLSGSRTSGGLSCIVWWIPYKNNYRKYKIKTANKSDDYQALREIIIRRFKLSKQKTKPDIPDDELPSLFILDGWVGQLGIVKAMTQDYPQLQKIREQTQFASLEKGDARRRSARAWGATETLHVLADDGNILSKNCIYDQADKLLFSLRDEAHRFANVYRKKRMSKEWK